MANDYFRFKEFIIRQNRCAMKVCTDSCLFGAWTIQFLEDSKFILDIGSGTGLLSLMLAQKSSAHINGIEYDPESYFQSVENIEESTLANRIDIVQGDIRNYRFKDLFDFIITNPPFYENDLQSPEEKINSARHGITLNFRELISAIDQNLRPSGQFAVLLPFHRSGYFENLASEKNFYLQQTVSVRQMPQHEPVRSFNVYARLPVHTPQRTEISIRNEKNKYSTEFIQLMDEFYEKIAFGTDE